MHRNDSINWSVCKLVIYQIPACAGMTALTGRLQIGECQIPACTGMTALTGRLQIGECQIPACTGMTVLMDGCKHVIYQIHVCAEMTASRAIVYRNDVLYN